MPFGRVAVVMTGGTGVTGALLIIMLNAIVASGETPFAALTVKLNVPAVVGVPEITPPLERLKPPGRVPLSMSQVIVASPVAVSCSLYAVPTVPSGNVVVVIVGALPIGVTGSTVKHTSNCSEIPLPPLTVTVAV